MVLWYKCRGFTLNLLSIEKNNQAGPKKEELPCIRTTENKFITFKFHANILIILQT